MPQGQGSAERERRDVDIKRSPLSRGRERAGVAGRSRLDKAPLAQGLKR